MKRLLAIALLCTLLPAPRGQAADPAPPIGLNLPVACIPGQTCWIFNYFDHDPGDGAKDYRCGAMTYDKHDGTDFALADYAAMRRGVPALAAAEGKVRFARDGMDDVSFREVPTEDINHRACGNSVILDHEGGWSTQYCHMRKESVRVKPGDTVKEGQPIGLVGLSGLTEFPHLHIAVALGDKLIDPFVGSTAPSNCGATVKPLWKPAVQSVLDYKRGIPYIAGITDTLPSDKSARDGMITERDIDGATKAIYVWADFIGIEAGDTLTFRLEGPDSKLLGERSQVLPSTKQRLFRTAAYNLSGGRWAPGIYKAEITLTPRGGGAGWHNQARREVTVR